jgi:hypothetical protein
MYGGGGGNRKGVQPNEIKHLQTEQVPQECLRDFRFFTRHVIVNAADSSSGRAERDFSTWRGRVACRGKQRRHALSGRFTNGFVSGLLLRKSFAPRRFYQRHKHRNRRGGEIEFPADRPSRLVAVSNQLDRLGLELITKSPPASSCHVDLRREFRPSLDVHKIAAWSREVVLVFSSVRP